MATVKYAVHETPNPKGNGKKTYHVRPVSTRAIKTTQFVNDISEMSSFSSADVKGMLDAFSTILQRYLAEGSTIELEGIGLFSISISCPKDMEDPGKIRANNIHFKKVNFKSSSKLNQELQTMRFVKASEDKQQPAYTVEKRQERILNYIQKEGSIQSSTCMSLNHCSRYVALKDLKELLANGKIKKHGNKASLVYLPAK